MSLSHLRLPLWCVFIIAQEHYRHTDQPTTKIFFPRSIEGEIAARDAAEERKRSRSAASHVGTHVGTHQQSLSFSRTRDAYPRPASPVNQQFNHYSRDVPYEVGRQNWQDEDRDVSAVPLSLRRARKNEHSESKLSIHNISMNPMISNFKSPIGE